MGIVTMGIPHQITIELAKLNNTSVFIETGTHYGGTTKWAANHFESVHTIERAVNLFNQHSNELAQVDGVTVYLGDSRDVLPDIMHNIGDQRCVFWLDGHWSGGETAGENDECPLLDELACLSNRYNDIILIDDARLFLCAPPLPHNPTQWPTITEIISALPISDKPPFIQIVDDVIFIIPNEDVLKTRLIHYAQTRTNVFWAEFTKLRSGSVTLNSRIKNGLKKIFRKVVK